MLLIPIFLDSESKLAYLMVIQRSCIICCACMSYSNCTSSSVIGVHMATDRRGPRTYLYLGFWIWFLWYMIEFWFVTAIADTELQHKTRNTRHKWDSNLPSGGLRYTNLDRAATVIGDLHLTVKLSECKPWRRMKDWGRNSLLILSIAAWTVDLASKALVPFSENLYHICRIHSSWNCNFNCPHLISEVLVVSDVWLTVHRNSVWIRKTN